MMSFQPGVKFRLLTGLRSRRWRVVARETFEDAVLFGRWAEEVVLILERDVFLEHIHTGAGPNILVFKLHRISTARPRPDRYVPSPNSPGDTSTRAHPSTPH